MKRSRFTENQIVAILKEADAGMLVKDICQDGWGRVQEVCFVDKTPLVVSSKC